MCLQLRRARRRTDTQDIELAMDMMVIFSKKEDRNADSAIIERLAKKLELHSIEDLKNETIAVRNILKERGYQTSESTQQMIDLLNKFKQVAGMEITSVLHDPVPKMQKSQSLVIPHEFLCPITLEIMRDPVIIASGQVICNYNNNNNKINFLIIVNLLKKNIEIFIYVNLLTFFFVN